MEFLIITIVVISAVSCFAWLFLSFIMLLTYGFTAESYIMNEDLIVPSFSLLICIINSFLLLLLSLKFLLFFIFVLYLVIGYIFSLKYFPSIDFGIKGNKKIGENMETRLFILTLVAVWPLVSSAIIIKSFFNFFANYGKKYNLFSYIKTPMKELRKEKNKKAGL